MDAQATQMGLIGAAGGFGLTALIAGVMLALEKGRNRRLQEDVERLTALASSPQEHEYRIEMFDVLWYPNITWSPKNNEVLKTSAGVPHCKDCSQALKSSGDGKSWACPKCARTAPGTVTDIVVMDQVAEKALKYFTQRHPDIQPSAAS
jgi:ribosomal protein L37AE/L43A